jgi:NAD(P)-dependent dehydrogenase (short-subunit alcohol dehydrogenase family)
MLTTQYAKALPGIRINAADPGYTATDLNANSRSADRHRGHRCHRRPGHRGPGHGSGRFVDRHGEIAWS